MFFRLKTSGPRRYLQLVENRRDRGTVRQQVLATVGRLDELASTGALAALLASGARFCEQVLLLAALDHPDQEPRLRTRRIGAPLVFGRLWQETGCRVVIEAALNGRAFAFPVERAIFTAVLHRIMVSGSDRACEKWRADYAIPGAEDLDLHHFYRAMAWLGEELPGEEAQRHATPFAPRTVKDTIEEALFARRRDLFSDLSVVFLDTTSLAFTGDGGATLGARGHSKDHRPDLQQMIVGVVIDAKGRPICSELWPGNTADVGVLLPVIDRLRHRFGIGRVCIVADRGMIAAATLAALEERGLEYILGARERSDKLVREVALADSRPFTPLLVERVRGDTQLFVKEVMVDKRRYIVCRNEAEAAKDAATRAAVVDGLDRQLRQGDKALIGNAAYRRYLRRVRPADGGKTGPAFEIDPGKLAEEARFDGIFVLRTNAKVTPLQAVLRYRDLLQVEELFRTAKTLLRTRPIYHSCDEAIRGHVFCSFLALVLRKELQGRWEAGALKPEWGDLLRDLDRLQEATLAQDGKTWRLRTEATGAVPPLLKALGIALPPRLQATGPPAAAVPAPRTRRGRPRRSATCA
ncbi:MAG TPA: IS1634 family transposase [Xanthobacteraceae bacterium]|nr:IS1634 family transposase [Xanthobacteraceae bacterium]